MMIPLNVALKGAEVVKQYSDNAELIRQLSERKGDFVREVGYLKQHIHSTSDNAIVDGSHSGSFYRLIKIQELAGEINNRIAELNRTNEQLAKTE